MIEGLVSDTVVLSEDAFTNVSPRFHVLMLIPSLRFRVNLEKQETQGRPGKQAQG